MRHPSYLLNPGDMFQVDMERVLFATGAPKDINQARAGRAARSRMRRRVKETAPSQIGAKKKKLIARRQLQEAEQAKSEPASVASLDIEEIRALRREDFNHILTKIENALANKQERLGAKRKQA